MSRNTWVFNWSRQYWSFDMKYISILSLSLLLGSAGAFAGSKGSTMAHEPPSPRRAAAPPPQVAQPAPPRVLTIGDLEVEALQQINQGGQEAPVGVGDYRLKFAPRFEGHNDLDIWGIFKNWAHLPQGLADNELLGPRWQDGLKIALKEFLRLKRDVLTLYSMTGISTSRPQVIAKSENGDAQTLTSLTGLAVEWLRKRDDFSPYLPDYIKLPVAQRIADASDRVSQSSGSSVGSLQSRRLARSETSSQGGRSVGGVVYLSALGEAEQQDCIRNRRIGRVLGSLIVAEGEHQREKKNGLWHFRYLGVQPYTSNGVGTGVLTAGIEGNPLCAEGEPLWSLGVIHYMDMVGQSLKPSGEPSGNVVGRRYRGGAETLEERLKTIKATCKNVVEGQDIPGMKFFSGQEGVAQFSAFLVQVIEEFVKLHRTNIEDPRLEFLNRLRKGIDALLECMGEEDRDGYQIFAMVQENSSLTTKEIFPTQFCQLIFRMPAKGPRSQGDVSVDIPAEQLAQEDPFSEFRMQVREEEERSSLEAVEGEEGEESAAVSAKSGGEEEVEDVIVQRQVVALTLSAYGEISALGKQMKKESSGSSSRGTSRSSSSSSSSHRPYSAKKGGDAGGSSSSSSRSRGSSKERHALQEVDAENTPPPKDE